MRPEKANCLVMFQFATNQAYQLLPKTRHCGNLKIEDLKKLEYTLSGPLHSSLIFVHRLIYAFCVRLFAYCTRTRANQANSLDMFQLRTHTFKIQDRGRSIKKLD